MASTRSAYHAGREVESICDFPSNVLGPWCPFLSKDMVMACVRVLGWCIDEAEEAGTKAVGGKWQGSVIRT